MVVAAATTEPSLLSRVEPVYPKSRLAYAEDGQATIVFDVDVAGHVVNARVKSATTPEFGRAAMAAIMQRSYQPALKDGRPMI